LHFGFFFLPAFPLDTGTTLRQKIYCQKNADITQLDYVRPHSWKAKDDLLYYLALRQGLIIPSSLACLVKVSAITAVVIFVTLYFG